MLTLATNNTTRQGLITLQAYLSGIECLPLHRPRRSRHYEQALLATIPVLDFTTEEAVAIVVVVTAIVVKLYKKESL